MARAREPRFEQTVVLTPANAIGKQWTARTRVYVYVGLAILFALLPLAAVAWTAEPRTSHPPLVPVAWGLWALVSLWIALDARRIFRIAGLRGTPLRTPSKVLSGMALCNLLLAIYALFALAR